MPGRTLVSVIVDRDTGEFSVEGPMTHDRAPAELSGRRRPESRPQYSLLPYEGRAARRRRRSQMASSHIVAEESLPGRS